MTEEGIIECTKKKEIRRERERMRDRDREKVKKARSMDSIASRSVA